MLSLSVVALGSASDFFLPEIPFIVIFSIALLGAAYSLEDRFSLSLPSANIVGGILGFIVACWIGYQFIRPGVSLLDTLPFPASLLPYLSPVLMILIPAKMLRPKHVGDYWTMFGLAVMSMGLACTMASDLSFGFFLFGWLILFVWSLALFFLCREIVWPNNFPTALIESRWTLLSASLRWVMSFGLLGLGIFLLTPRPTESRWALTSRSLGRIDIGLSNDNTIDLNRTGTLSQNPGEKAFEVRVKNFDGTPKDDLNPSQRWRSTTMLSYQDGKWSRSSFASGGSIMLRELSIPNNAPDNNIRRALPVLSPEQFYITFIRDSKLAPTIILADPVYWRANLPSPIASIADSQNSYVSFDPKIDGSFQPIPDLRRNEYTQVALPQLESDLGPPLYDVHWIPESTLLNRLPAKIQTDLAPWVLALIDELIAKNQIPGITKREMNTNYPDWIEWKQQEPIARALDKYLSSSGVYLYSSTLGRSDKSIDPILDFLFKIKMGHCERFASGLVLMLRSVGIPCQMVMGFKGCTAEQEGVYSIYSDDAHAWVEVLLRQPEPKNAAQPKRVNQFAEGDDPGERFIYRWLTLDPTPGTEARTSTTSKTTWMEGFWARIDRFYKEFILGYNPAVREKTAEYILAQVLAIRTFLQKEGWLWLVTGGISFLALLAYLRRRHQRKILENQEADPLLQLPGVKFHNRLLELLKRFGFEPEVGQTPREFGTRVTAALERSLGVLATVPAEAAELYYRSRYGNEQISPEELVKFDNKINLFESALKTSPD